ncbi:MAG: NADH-quinone oxidoreductase subunit H [Spirochaetales bacterium]|nr:NADH-quinone oxidoreductase subunit H [Spirochaetales bacterium]
MDNRKINDIEKYKKRVHLMFSELDIKAALREINALAPELIITELITSGLRGRGGAGFPTGKKWEMVSEAEGTEKYIVCNADEGEPGTFKDREILQKQAAKVLLGMTACSKAVGARKGFIYLRGEYSYMRKDLSAQIEAFHKLLNDFKIDFSIELRMGSGAYVCGEETSLLESLEGRRGEARNKPPYPVTEGFMGKPTVVNNVETLVYAVYIILEGTDSFIQMGTKSSRGAKVFCVSGDTPVPGIYELELGMKLSDFVDLFGDDDTKAVQVGGVSGYCVPRKNFSKTIIGFEGVPTGGSMMLFNSSRSMYNVLHDYLEFFSEESCGQCTPCRIGCQQLLKGIEQVKRGTKHSSYLDNLREIAETMSIASKCGLGQSVAHPFISTTDYFKEEIIY